MTAPPPLAAASQAPLLQHPQRRGVSFDAMGNVGDRREAEQPNGTSSARGNFAHPRTVFPDTTTTEFAGFATQVVPANVIAAFAGPSALPQVRSPGHAHEQPIPVYVPLQKQGSLSKATHRRSSSRTGASDGGGTEAGGGGGGGGGSGALRASGPARSSSPPESPFYAVRSPPKFLPPVPAFSGMVSPPPPPSMNQPGHGHGHGRSSSAADARGLDYSSVPSAGGSPAEVSGAPLRLQLSGVAGTSGASAVDSPRAGFSPVRALLVTCAVPGSHFAGHALTCLACNICWYSNRWVCVL